MSLIKPIMPYVKLAAWLLAVGAALGLIGSLFFPQVVSQLLSSVFSMLEELGKEILQEQPPLQGTITLFMHNLRAVFGMSLFGVVLGIFPLLGMLVNGSLLGVVLAAGLTGQASLLAIVVGILPHGVIEIPALVIGAGTGLYLGWGVFNKRLWPGYKVAFVHAFKAFVLCTIMLAVAAIIEVNITPVLIDLVR